MSTVRLAVSAIVDAHRRVGLDSPVTVGVSETLRGLTRRGAEAGEATGRRCSCRNQGDRAHPENDTGWLA